MENEPTPNVEPADPPKRRRLRFSLLNLMLAMTVVAMAGTIWQLAPLYFEVKKLREETGQLTVWNRNEVHAIQVPTYQENAYKWRIWVPEGRQLEVKATTSRIPGKQVPDVGRRLPLARGQEKHAREEVITLSINKKLDESIAWNLSHDGMTMHFSLPDNANEWLLAGSSGFSTKGVSQTTRQAPADEPFVLLRQRHFYDDSGQTPPADEPELTDGILVWITDVD